MLECIFDFIQLARVERRDLNAVSMYHILSITTSFLTRSESCRTAFLRISPLVSFILSFSSFHFSRSVHTHLRRLSEEPRSTGDSKTSELCDEISQSSCTGRYVFTCDKKGLLGSQCSAFLTSTLADAALFHDKKRNHIKTLDEYYHIRANITSDGVRKTVIGLFDRIDREKDSELYQALALLMGSDGEWLFTAKQSDQNVRTKPNQKTD